MFVQKLQQTVDERHVEICDLRTTVARLQQVINNNSIIVINDTMLSIVCDREHFLLRPLVCGTVFHSMSPRDLRSFEIRFEFESAVQFNSCLLLCGS